MLPCWQRQPLCNTLKHLDQSHYPHCISIYTDTCISSLKCWHFLEAVSFCSVLSEQQESPAVTPSLAIKQLTCTTQTRPHPSCRVDTAKKSCCVITSRAWKVNTNSASWKRRCTVFMLKFLDCNCAWKFQEWQWQRDAEGCRERASISLGEGFFGGWALPTWWHISPGSRSPLKSHLNARQMCLLLSSKK